MAKRRRRKLGFEAAKSQELPRERKRRARVDVVHPNSTAARVWGRETWTYHET